MISGGECARRDLSNTTCAARPPGAAASLLFEESQNVGRGMTFVQVGEDFAVAMFIAANRSIVPLRL